MTMRSLRLSPLARQIGDRIKILYPAWEQYFDEHNGDLEVAVPAPPESKAGHLVIFTTEGRNIWVRFSPPHMCYSVGDVDEMLSLIADLLTDQVVFVVVTKDHEWQETTLIHREERLHLESDEAAQVVSWSGKHDEQ
jgi:hypothetical protein